MNNCQKLLSVIEQLSDEELSTLLDFAIFLKSRKTSIHPIEQSQAYQNWVSPENDIYDEVFADELTAR